MPIRRLTAAPVDPLSSFLHAVAKLEELHTTTREAANKEATHKKAVVAAFLALKLPPKGFVRIGNVKYIYDVTTSATSITPEVWESLLTQGQISREDWLRALSVSKTIATEIIGQDQVQTHEQVVVGKKKDLREITVEGRPGEIEVGPARTVQSAPRPLVKVVPRGRGIELKR